MTTITIDGERAVVLTLHADGNIDVTGSARGDCPDAALDMALLHGVADLIQCADIEDSGPAAELVRELIARGQRVMRESAHS